MVSDLRITLVQADLAWENVAANSDRFTRLLAPMTGSTDLVILPEMCTTGFTRNGGVLAETMDGATVCWLRELARKIGAVITGSIIIQDQALLYNRLIWAVPDGELHYYDKHHLFRYAGEHSVYAAGAEKCIFEYKGWKIRPFICYELRFPVWSMNVQKGYDLGIYVANWPEIRSEHWKALLTARAIENQAYIVGVNRIGRDGNNLVYSGDSTLLGPQGNRIHACGATEEIVTCTISRAELEEYRDRFPAWMDID